MDGLILGVPFTGKPDCRFVLDLGQGRIPCIYDWKVRGYCSKYGAVPVERLRDLPGWLRGQGQPEPGQGARPVQGDGLPGPDDQLRLHGVLQRRVRRPAFPLRLAAGREDRRREHGAGYRGIVCQVHGRGQSAHAPLRPPSRPGQGRLPAEARRESGDLLAGHHQRPRLFDPQPRRQRCPLRRPGRNVRGSGVETARPWTTGSTTSPAPASFTKPCPFHCSCSTGSRVPP